MLQISDDFEDQEQDKKRNKTDINLINKIGLEESFKIFYENMNNCRKLMKILGIESIVINEILIYLENRVLKYRK